MLIGSENRASFAGSEYLLSCIMRLPLVPKRHFEALSRIDDRLSHVVSWHGLRRDQQACLTERCS